MEPHTKMNPDEEVNGLKFEVRHKSPRQLLNPASGFLKEYSHTLNPYGGCAFACSYCYVREMPIALFRGQPWGTWVDVKEGAAQRLKKEIVKAKKKGPVTVFMSSSTDPYQPVEYKERITRTLLETMAEEQPDFLFVQTRSPLVTRDIDLFVRFGDNIRISMTVETDLEPVRRAFTPAAPPIQARLRALKSIVAAGLPAQATFAPLLPCTDRLPAILADIVDRVCLDDYFMGDGSQGKRTQRLRIESIYRKHHWEDWYSPTAYLRMVEQLKRFFSEEQILISQEGFLPR